MEKAKIEELKREIEQYAEEKVLDFVSDYELQNINYLDDSFREFADNNTSLYYSEQREYYNEHRNECEDALLEYYDGDFIANKIKKEGIDSLICFCGAIGEYNNIYNELSQNEEDVKKLLVLRHILKYDIFNITEEQLNDVLKACESWKNDPKDLLEMLENLGA